MNDLIYFCAGGFEHDTFEKDMRIWLGALDKNGAIRPVGSVPAKCNFGYICAGPDGRNIYAVDARLDRGSLLSYRAKPNGQLEFQGALPLPGAKLALHCTASQDGRYVLVACGDSSNVYVCEMDDRGCAARITDVFVLPPGKGTLPRQMKGPAPHQVQFDRSGRYVFLPDIHADRMLVLRFDDGRMHLVFSEPVLPGDGPRHCVVDQENRHVYLLTEMGNAIITFTFDAETGTLELLDRICLVPEEYAVAHTDVEIQSGAIQLSPDGRYLFASMRNYFMPDGTDRLFRMKIGSDGLPGSPESFSCGGYCPRMFDFVADGHFMLVGNKFSNEILSYEYDAQTGGLSGPMGRMDAEENAAIAVFKPKI